MHCTIDTYSLSVCMYGFQLSDLSRPLLMISLSRTENSDLLQHLVITFPMIKAHFLMQSSALVFVK